MAHSSQRGFRRGKLLTDSVLLLSAHTERHITLGGPCPAQILLDIKAAFPSVLWAWLWWLLSQMGCPCWLINAVKALYIGSSVCLSLGFTEEEGFELSSGIKQGCPMSGDIWCLIFDPFIRALIKGLEGLDALVTAFADDLGIPCSDLIAALRALLPIVGLMRAAAGLTLNWKKTIFVNFSVFSEFELRRRIEQMVPVATAAKISEFARYLGFITGPLAHMQAWGRPYKRILERARHVRSLGLSLLVCSCF